MITDNDGNVRRRLFFDNIRDFHGDTPVNNSIAETLLPDTSIEFPLRDNGITIVARKLQRVGPQFTLEEFQIVNGCQTSHVIAANSEEKNQATTSAIEREAVLGKFGPDREGLIETPTRGRPRLWFAGYGEEPDEFVQRTFRRLSDMTRWCYCATSASCPIAIITWRPRRLA